MDNAFGEPDITVNSTLDAVDANPGDGICADAIGNCTLRAAIMESNAFPLTQTIHVPAGTYLLTIPGTDEDAAATGDLDITDPLLLIGDGQGETIIDGNDLDRVFHFVGIQQSEYASVDEFPMIASMMIQRGNAPYGGGVLVSDSRFVILSQVTLRDNYAYGQHPCGQSAGAAAYSTDSMLLLFRATVTENRTPSTDLSTHYGALGGYMETWLSSIVNNQTDWAFVSDNSTCIDQTFGGYIDNSVIADNSGGAIYLYRALSVSDSTITQNGAGIVIDHPASPPSYLFLTGFSHVTLADNNVYGLKFIQPRPMILRHSIISGHSQDCDVADALVIDPDFEVNYGLSEYNLISDDMCPLSGSTHLINTDPELLPLADNGGLTLTRAVAPTSPAIDAIPDCQADSDQRGRFPQSPGCTIGAYEYNDGGVDFPPSTSISSGPQEGEFGDFLLSKYLYIRFSQQMYNPSGDTDPDDVTNPNNYLLVMSGTDAGFQTTACGGDIQTNEIVVPITNVTYNAPWFANYADLDVLATIGGTIEFDPQVLGATDDYLPVGDYTFYVCDNVRDLKGVHLDGDGDYYSGGNYAYTFTNLGLPRPHVVSVSAYVGNNRISTISPGRNLTSSV
ncbi:MAG: CSLREA domain-containing protein, partial [Anaerolineae bacterium]|nr:CSLREA domain-containing protein [Anaerolineae bacterium]